jgi:hypothetical protein
MVLLLSYFVSAFRIRGVESRLSGKQISCFINKDHCNFSILNRRLSKSYKRLRAGFAVRKQRASGDLLALLTKQRRKALILTVQTGGKTAKKN